MENINDILNKQNGGDNSPRNSQVTGAGGQNPQTANAGNHSPVQPSMGYQNSVLPNTGYQNPTPQNTGYQNPVMTSTGYKNPTQPGGGYISPKPPKKDNKRLIAVIAIIAAVVIVAMIVVCVFAFGNNKKPIGGVTPTSTSVDITTKNEDTTSSIKYNINNRMSVKVDDWIYYIDESTYRESNHFSVFRIQEDGSNKQEITDSKSGESLDAFQLIYYDGYIYFNNSMKYLSKLNVETNEVTNIANGKYNDMAIVDGYIYCITAGEGPNEQIVKISTSGEKTLLKDANVDVNNDNTQLARYDSMTIVNGWIYYALYMIEGDVNKETFKFTPKTYIGRMKLDGSENQKINEEKALNETNCTYRLFTDNCNLYYIDYADDYAHYGKLIKIYDSKKIVLDDNVTYANADNGYIYYSKKVDSTKNELWRADIDGSKLEKIIDDNLYTIDIINNHLIYHISKSNSVVMVNTDGTNRIELK